MSKSNRGRDQIRQRLKEDLVKPMTKDERAFMAHLDSPAQSAQQATAAENETTPTGCVCPVDGKTCWACGGDPSGCEDAAWLNAPMGPVGTSTQERVGAAVAALIRQWRADADKYHRLVMGNRSGKSEKRTERAALAIAFAKCANDLEAAIAKAEGR